jgi:hypothetical protein
MDCFLQNVTEFCEKIYAAREIVSVVIWMGVKILKHTSINSALLKLPLCHTFFIDEYLHALILSLRINNAAFRNFN